MADFVKQDATNANIKHDGTEGTPGATLTAPETSNYITQINAGGTVYDIATHHTITFTEGSNNSDPTSIVWNGLDDITINIPDITDLVQNPVTLVGTTEDGVAITPISPATATAFTGTHTIGELVYVTKEYTKDNEVFNAGDMLIWDGTSWKHISKEINYVATVDKNAATTLTAAATVGSQDIKLTPTANDQFAGDAKSGEYSVTAQTVGTDITVTAAGEGKTGSVVTGVTPTMAAVDGSATINEVGLKLTATEETTGDSTFAKAGEYDVTGTAVSTSALKASAFTAEGVWSAGTAPSKNEKLDITVNGTVTLTAENDTNGDFVTEISGKKAGDALKSLGSAIGGASLSKKDNGNDFVVGLSELGTDDTADVVSAVTFKSATGASAAAVAAATAGSVMATAKVDKHVLSFETITLDTTGKKFAKGGYDITTTPAEFGDDDKIVVNTYAVSAKGKYTAELSNAGGSIAADTFVTDVTIPSFDASKLSDSAISGTVTQGKVTVDAHDAVKKTTYSLGTVTTGADVTVGASGNATVSIAADKVVTGITVTTGTPALTSGEVSVGKVTVNAATAANGKTIEVNTYALSAGTAGTGETGATVGKAGDIDVNIAADTFVKDVYLNGTVAAKK